MGASPLVLTLDSATSTNRRPYHCSCSVVPAPVLALAMMFVHGSWYLWPVQELLREVGFMADLAAGTIDHKVEKHKQLDTGAL